MATLVGGGALQVLLSLAEVLHSGLHLGLPFVPLGLPLVALVLPFPVAAPPAPSPIALSPATEQSAIYGASFGVFEQALLAVWASRIDVQHFPLPWGGINTKRAVP